MKGILVQPTCQVPTASWLSFFSFLFTKKFLFSITEMICCYLNLIYSTLFKKQMLRQKMLRMLRIKASNGWENGKAKPRNWEGLQPAVWDACCQSESSLVSSTIYYINVVNTSSTRSKLVVNVDCPYTAVLARIWTGNGSRVTRYIDCHIAKNVYLSYLVEINLTILWDHVQTTLIEWEVILTPPSYLDYFTRLFY